MSTEPTPLDEKREKALQRLRGNRGKERTGTTSRQEAKADGVKVLLKDYRDVYREQKAEFQKTEGYEPPPLPAEPEELPKFAKASDRLKEKEAALAESVNRLKEARQRFKEAKESRKLAPEPPAALKTPESDGEQEAGAAKRQNLRKDMLSADFFKSASQWLGSIRAEPHLSSTSLEEIETLYQQAKYRYKVMKILLEDTQRELDGFEAYLRMAQSLPNSPD